VLVENAGHKESAILAKIFKRSYTHLVKVKPTPLGGIFACMSIKDGKEALPTYTSVIVHEAMRVLHGTPFALVIG
jgi:hypothetical protein